MSGKIFRKHNELNSPVIILLCIMGMDFEETAQYFRDRGYTNINRVANDGIDIIALSPDQKRVGIRWKNGKVGRHTIEKFHAALIEGNIERGFVLSDSFTTKAREYTREINGQNIQIDLLYYPDLKIKPIQKPVRKPHWHFRLLKSLVSITIQGIYWFLFILVLFNIEEEARASYHVWKGVYYLMGLMGAILLVYPLNFVRLGIADMMERWIQYLLITFILYGIANIISIMTGKGSIF